MNDLFTARSQRNITYLWLVGFFGILIGEGLGYIKDVPHESLFALTGAVLFFWFQRTRAQEPSTVPPTPKEPSSEA
jgi:hypothetical protein